MHARNRWQNGCWAAGLAFALAAAVVELAVATATAAAQPAAKPAAPASLEEATRAIDFRKFLLPDGGKDIYKSAEIPKGDSGKDVRRSAAELNYVLRKGSGAQAAQYCRTQLAEAGWKLADGPDSREDYFTFTGSKQGFLLTGGVYVYPDSGELSVRITNHGNIDSRTLPRVAGAELSAAELKYNDACTTNYQAAAKPEAILEFMRTELEKKVWREVKGPGWRREKLDRYARFIQRGIMVSISVRDKGVDVKDGKTTVMNSVRVLREELPIMPDTKNEVEFVDSWTSDLHYYFHLHYAAPTGPEKVLEFYRKELPALGWTMRAGTDQIVNGRAKVMLDAPEKNPLRLELLATKEDTLVLIANVVQETRDTPKTAAKGTLTMGDATYKLVNALAYETMRSNRKETVVILSEKLLDTAKLMKSLKKNGTDDDFFPMGAHVKLRFDDKGALAQTDIYADGATIIGSGNDNIKATATIKNGTAKGKAAMEKPEKFFKMSFQFEATFDVAVLQLAGAEPKPPVDPITEKITPVEPGKSAVVTDKELRIEGKLADNSPMVMGKPAQIHHVKMSAAKTYLIDLESKDFDTYLRILDAAGKQLANDDDGGEGLNARLRFTPPKDGDYQVVATRFSSGQGNYLLKIRDLTPGEPGKPAPVTENELRFEGKLANNSPKVMGKPAQIHKVKMSPEKTYVIDLESKDFDAYLHILDAGGKLLASDDDSGGNRNARIRFTPAKEDTYQVVATRFGSGQGNYLLKIRVLGVGDEKQP